LGLQLHLHQSFGRFSFYLSFTAIFFVRLTFSSVDGSPSFTSEGKQSPRLTLDPLATEGVVQSVSSPDTRST
jgi:hypothetical protein